MFKRIGMAGFVLGMLGACGSAPEADDVGSVSSFTPAPNQSSAMAPKAPAPSLSASSAPAAPPVGPPVDLLRLSRVDVGGHAHVIAITKDDGASLTGVDLTIALADAAHYALDLVTTHGYAKVSAALASAPKITITRQELLPPIAEGTAQVNAAENYVDHQAETGAAETPFLFPKIAAPTGADVTVARQSGDLLDYETELCVAFGRDLGSVDDLAGTTVGFVLCNDLSERATQVLGLDPDNEASGKGFTDAKSRAGFLPLGPYVVVPRDPQALFPMLTLTLRVNGQQRQDDAPKNMIWDITRLVKEACAAGSNPRFSLAGKPIALLPNGKLAKGSLLVSGTPGGIILKAPTTAYKALKAAEYVATGAFLTGIGVETYVQQQLVADLRASHTFLKPGDVIDAQATFLGSQRITIGGVSD